MQDLGREVARRRTFAIISHPDAGKTTLTEKILLLGGAIQLAGAVKARGDQRRARSDWMKVERERGISVTASAMTFEYKNCVFNLLDTPGHQDFSEDTYRTLTAVDSAVMVLDAARGIEAQTRKLFEVCRLRNVPIVTFVNKLDREGREPFDLMQEIERDLALETTPASWPIGMGRTFRGCYDLLKDRLMLVERSKERLGAEVEECRGLDDPKLDELLPENSVKELREGAEMARTLCPKFSIDEYRAGHQTPVFFGSAINSFGVRELLDGLAEFAPPPRSQQTREREIKPDENKTTGFVFKVQANMDPKHRDRVAFIRLCSGHFRRGMKLLHARSGTTLAVHNPVLFLAQDRELAEDAFAGDIIGIPNHGKLGIGDALTEGEKLSFLGIPSFAPELLKQVRPTDPLRAKHLGRALEQLAEEGVARIFKPRLGGSTIVGVVGALQFDVLADRIENEYNIPVVFEATSLMTARWVEGTDNAALERFVRANESAVADDHSGSLVFMARNGWHLETTEKDWPMLVFKKTREYS
jgi:peptide chain release factor 3